MLVSMAKRRWQQGSQTQSFSYLLILSRRK
nr:MAG TPA: hypothetical protein [Caudoviricetes sp.]